MADMLTELERHLAGMHPLSHELAARCSHRFSADHALCSDTYRHYTHVQDARTVEASDWLKQLLTGTEARARAEGAADAMWKFFLRLPFSPTSDLVQREAMRLRAAVPTETGI